MRDKQGVRAQLKWRVFFRFEFKLLFFFPPPVLSSPQCFRLLDFLLLMGPGIKTVKRGSFIEFQGEKKNKANGTRVDSGLSLDELSSHLEYSDLKFSIVKKISYYCDRLFRRSKPRFFFQRSFRRLDCRIRTRHIRGGGGSSHLCRGGNFAHCSCRWSQRGFRGLVKTLKLSVSWWYERVSSSSSGEC